MGDRDFDVDAFLSQPLVARLATNGPTVRPVWYLWEEGAFWILTGSWAKLGQHIAGDPRVSLVIDTCDLATGEVRQVTASGRASIVPYERERARRKLARYLGADGSQWDATRFSAEPTLDSDARFLQLFPERLVARDLSYEAAGGSQSGDPRGPG